jgi:hypothetical protein
MYEPIKLIYRGLTFEYKSHLDRELPDRDTANSEDYPTKNVKLIYRGLTFERTIPLNPIYQKPRAINWRFQIPSKSSVNCIDR